MDKDTRNRIQRATQAARELLEHEYAEQLEGVFDVGLDGTIASEPGEHLDAAQRVLRTKLLTAVDHQRASGMTKADAVASYLREAAFTTLNRFVALKMLEARELVQECISRGDQSAGFKEFTGLAPGLVQLPDHGYRVYIESLFDEIGREVRVLFDRRDPASLLWPRRQGLLDLLGILNAVELGVVWGEDETIGWVYQYFNGEDERRAMREASQAPRNSRELAVRNQFFTPRYVVQFLVDNSLGRTWVEMMRGKTGLNGLDYLVRHEHEVYLAEGEDLTVGSYCNNLGKTPEHAFPTSFRPKKDPRDLKILDPACGSGHFLLYAFDLLLAIYEEAWQDADAAASASTGTTLRADYPENEELRAAVPGLILRHNIYGIDIDPRATQIAALALWLRAQRAFLGADIVRDQRPQITKTNIVVAEPMPGEAELRETFVSTLEPRLARLVNAVFDHMSLAGEAGCLIRITQRMEESIRKIFGDVGGLFSSAERDEWAKAATQLRRALETFATKAAAERSFARHLFVEDAARGLGFIDVCSQRYDVIVMNPPFGEPSLQSRDIVYSSYPAGKADIGAAFIEMAGDLILPQGFVGLLKNRALLFHDLLEDWRADYLLGRKLAVQSLADLGYGVLDAVVEVDAAVLASRPPAAATFVSCLATQEKKEALASATSSSACPTRYEHDLGRFRNVPLSKLVYFMSDPWLRQYKNPDPSAWFTSKAGLASGSDERFVRAHWEVPIEKLRDDHWRWFAKGGDFGRYTSDLHLVVRWGRPEVFRRPGDTNLYGMAGVTYTERTTSNLSVRVLNSGSSFSYAGPAIVTSDTRHAAFLLCYLNSFLVSYLVEAVSGAGDHSVRGSAARHFYPSYFDRIRIPEPSASDLDWADKAASSIVTGLLSVGRDETHATFCGPYLSTDATFNAIVRADIRQAYQLIAERYADVRNTQLRFSQLCGLNEKQLQEAYPFTGWPWPDSNAVSPQCAAILASLDPLEPSEQVDVGAPAEVESLRFLNKLSHYVSPTIEKISHAFDVRPEAACLVGAQSFEPDQKHINAFVARLMQWVVGCCFGRFDVRRAGVGRQQPSHKIFESLPACSPGMLADGDGLPILCAPSGYPIRFPSDGVLVDDAGADRDLLAGVRDAFEVLFGDPRARWDEASEALGGRATDIRSWIAREFFDFHVKGYSKSRRRAPIYWQLATPTSSYSIWLYYHRLTRDTLFRILHECITPKLQHEERRLQDMTQEVGPDASASERKESDVQTRFVHELRSFHEELAWVAPLWSPALDDGVIVNFAPLWRVVSHNRAWQNECKKVWDKLCKGDYDWAHLAMHLWPERVVPKCAKDRSLAIAHGLEDVFWYEDSDGKWQPRKVAQSDVDKLVKERTSAAVKDALKSLLEAPAPAAGRAARKKAPRAKGTRKRTASARPKAATNGASSSSRSSATVDADLLSTVKDAIGANGDGASKADVIDATGISASDWNKAIKALLADGSVTQTGERRGARYHLGGGDA